MALSVASGPGSGLGSESESEFAFALGPAAAPPGVPHVGAAHAEQVWAHITQTTTNMHRLVQRLRDVGKVTDIPSQERQMLILELLKAVYEHAGEGLVVACERNESALLARLARDADGEHTDAAVTRRYAAEAYQMMFRYFVDSFQHLHVLRKFADMGYVKIATGVMVVLSALYCNYAAFTREPDFARQERTTAMQFPTAVRTGLLTLWTKPISAYSCYELLEAYYRVYCVSNTMVFSSDMYALMNALAFRAMAITSSCMDGDAMDVALARVWCGCATEREGVRCYSAAPALVHTFSVLVHAFVTKFTRLFSLHRTRVLVAAQPRTWPRRILYSEAASLALWLVKSAPPAGGGGLQTLYAECCMRDGERQFYLDHFRSAAIDNPHLVLGTFREVPYFNRIEEDSRRTPWMMLTAEAARPGQSDPLAVMLAARETLMAHMAARHTDLDNTKDALFVLDNEHAAATLDALELSLQPVIVQAFNHPQLLCRATAAEGGEDTLFMYNNTMCAMVAWFREIAHRQRYSLRGNCIRSSTIDPIFRGPVAGPYSLSYYRRVTEALLAPCKADLVFDFDPFAANGTATPDPAAFDYAAFPDNLVYGRAPPEPVPCLDPYSSLYTASLHESLRALGANEIPPADPDGPMS